MAWCMRWHLLGGCCWEGQGGEKGGVLYIMATAWLLLREGGMGGGWSTTCKTESLYMI